jgi:hypothetical protein
MPVRATRRTRHGPLHFHYSSHRRAVKLLLDPGAETDAQNYIKAGLTAHRIASQEGAVIVVKNLVLSTRDSKARSPWADTEYEHRRRIGRSQNSANLCAFWHRRIL